MDGAGTFVVTAPEGAEDVLGLWQAAAAPASFAGEPEEGVLRWMVNLPTDYQAAAAAVKARAALLQRQRQALEEDAPRRFAAAAGVAGWAAGAAPDFASVQLSRVETRAPERDLATSLRALGATDAAGSASPYALGESGPDHRQGLLGEARAFVEQVSRATASYAWVETRQEGTLIARTAVRWLGGVTTQTRAGLDVQRVALHRDAVTLAVESRTAWLRAFLLAAQGATIVAAAVGALSTPAGALLVLPAAVRFLRQVLAEARQGQ